RTKLHTREEHETPRLPTGRGHGGAEQSTDGSRVDGQERRTRLQGCRRDYPNLLSQPAATTRLSETEEDVRDRWTEGRIREPVSILDPLVPLLGPAGQVQVA